MNRGRRIILRLIGCTYVVAIVTSIAGVIWSPTFARLNAREYFVVLCASVVLIPVTAIAAVWLSPRRTKAAKLAKTYELTMGFKALGASLSHLMSGGAEAPSVTKR